MERTHCGAKAPPTLTVTLTSSAPGTSAPSATGMRSTRRRTRSATVWPKVLAQLGRMMANSSPPTRATRSIGRTLSSSALATARMTWSPAAWPWLSLTRLKWSMSSASNKAGSPLRATRSTSRPSASSKARRLARPVSASRLDRSTSASISACCQAGDPGSPAGSDCPECDSNCSACSNCSVLVLVARADGALFKEWTAVAYRSGKGGGQSSSAMAGGSRGKRTLQTALLGPCQQQGPPDTGYADRCPLPTAHAPLPRPQAHDPIRRARDLVRRQR